MGIFYLIAIFPILLAFLFWCLSKKVNIPILLGGSLISFIFAGILHWIVYTTETLDTETWSGKVISATYEPPWVSSHLEAVYKTETYRDSKGNTHTREVFSHYKTVYRNEGNECYVQSDYGSYIDTISITKQKFDDLAQKFGETKKVPGSRSSYYSGDKFDYHLVNKNKWHEPTTTTKSFTNKIKSSKTLFSFTTEEIPPNIPDYPEFNSTFESNRNLSTKISTLALDQLNSNLGPTKKVNVIIVQGPSTDPLFANYLEAKWKGGKKNDLIIVHSEKNNWVRVLGWTESELVKRNIETILLTTPISNNLLPTIQSEIQKNYQIKDWTKFDYISIEPPTWAYITYIIGLFLIQLTYWLIIFIAQHEPEIKYKLNKPLTHIYGQRRYL
jgi:hypothetical protein